VFVNVKVALTIRREIERSQPDALNRPFDKLM